MRAEYKAQIEASNSANVHYYWYETMGDDSSPISDESLLGLSQCPYYIQNLYYDVTSYIDVTYMTNKTS